MADPRVHVTIRVSPSGVFKVAELATELGVPSAAIHRAALIVAFRHEPELRLLIKEMK